MRKAVLGCAVAVLAAPLLVAPAAEAASRPTGGLHGWARLDPYSSTPGADRLTLTIDARTRHRPAPGRPAAARGHAAIEHEFPNPDGTTSTVRIEVAVDCLVTTGATTAVTGRVESLRFTVPPGHEQPPGPAAGWRPETVFSLYTDDSGQRRVGWPLLPDYQDPTAPSTARRCEAPEPTAADLHLVEGGFRLRR
ncbi:hypothetical protein ACWGB8_03965 [Kitasatospora sp. NPDC054939]